VHLRLAHRLRRGARLHLAVRYVAADGRVAVTQRSVSVG
jgi:hypothetical protein